MLGAPLTASAVGTATLSWNRNPEADIAGYRIYYGTTSGRYAQMSDVGNAVQADVSNLSVGNTYYFVVTAYNTSGDESLPSSEVFKVMPANRPPVVSLQTSFGAIVLVAPAIGEPSRVHWSPDSPSCRSTVARRTQAAVPSS